LAQAVAILTIKGVGSFDGIPAPTLELDVSAEKFMGLTTADGAQ
jgi:hypothetical protein